MFSRYTYCRASSVVKSVPQRRFLWRTSKQNWVSQRHRPCPAISKVSVSSPFLNGDNTLCLHLASVCHRGVAEARQRTLGSSRSEFALRDRSLVCWLGLVMSWACLSLVALPYRYWDLITCALILHQGGSNFGWEGPFAPFDRFVGAIFWDDGGLCAVDDASKCSLSNRLLERVFRIFILFFCSDSAASCNLELSVYIYRLARAPNLSAPM